MVIAFYIDRLFMLVELVEIVMIVVSSTNL